MLTIRLSKDAPAIPIPPAVQHEGPAAIDAYVAAESAKANLPEASAEGSAAPAKGKRAAASAAQPSPASEE